MTQIKVKTEIITEQMRNIENPNETIDPIITNETKNLQEVEQGSYYFKFNRSKNKSNNKAHAIKI